MIKLELWQKIGLYVLLLGSFYIYVKISNIKINGIPLLRQKYRILLAIFFPLILAGAILIGSFLLAAALIVLVAILLYGFFTKKKFKIQIKTRIPRRPLN